MSRVSMKCRYCDALGGHDAGCVVEKDDRIAKLEAELATVRQQLSFANADATKLDAERAAHARTQAEAVEKHNALIHAYEVLRSPNVRPSGHSGDEEGGQCDDDCAKCAAEGALAHADEALDDAAVGRRALAERVTLWRELEIAVRDEHGRFGVSDETSDVLDKLAALKDPA